MTEQMLSTLLAELGVGAILAAFFWYLIRWGIPKILDDAKEERRLQDARFDAMMLRFGDKLDRLTDRIEEGLRLCGSCRNYESIGTDKRKSPTGGQ